MKDTKNLNVGEKNCTVERDNWGSKTEFILSCLSYAIGIGNIWRFPYMCYRNGGGKFVALYTTIIFCHLGNKSVHLNYITSTSCLQVFSVKK